METPPPETRDQQPKKMKVDKRHRSVKECYLEEFGIVDMDGVAVCVICKTQLLYREFSARRLK